MKMTMWRLNRRRLLLTKVLLVLFNQLMVIGIYGKLCEVETGQNNIIVDIEETRGNNGNAFVSNENSPVLPIHGDVDDEITLSLNLPEGSNNLFKLNGKILQLVHPLDRDKENLSHIQFSISCSIKSMPSRSRNIPIIVRVSDINDETPVFINTPYETSIDESTPVGTTIFSDIKATDIDAGVNGAVEYFVVEGTANNFTDNDNVKIADGYGTFAIAYRHQGHVTVVKSLDYERVQRYYLTIIASDRARNVSERLSATTTLTINIRDSNDQDPTFIYKDCLFFEGSCINPEYFASIIPGTVQKNLSIYPEAIKAIDLDALNASIRYSFYDGTPRSFNEYFEIDEITGEIRQIKLVDSSVADRQFIITIKAEEMTEEQRFTTAKLTINVKAVDAHPPTIIASDLLGFVEENAPIGTKVLSMKNKLPIKFSIKDEDYSTEIDLPIYTFELTSSYLAIKDGYLIVNDGQIDREKAEKLFIQVVAREIKGNAASSPLSLNITILDQNDNAPEIYELQPVTVAAGKAKRLLSQAFAKDIDLGENASITFSLSTPNSRFTIDAKTGEIYSVDRLNANEKFNLTVRATDGGNLYSETNLIVSVIAGLNTHPPVFSKNIYEIQVNESMAINSTIVQVHAEDPENDAVNFSIVSGNDLRQFEINHESGIIRIIRKLDRETLTKYQMVVRAEDPDGLHTSAFVNVRVLDQNDNSPVFDEATLPYMFSIDEGKANAFVGSVQAYDIDEGKNGDIVYSLPSNVPFSINEETGEIYTKEKLNFKKQSEYEFMVKASDRGEPTPLSSEIRIKVIVKDSPTILPLFDKTYIEVKIPENVPDALVANVKIANRDLVPTVTFVIKKTSSKNLFVINQESGEIRTTKPLDYEMKSWHEIVVGTLENEGKNAGDFIKIKIIVEDRNDVAPIFLTALEPISITDDQMVGSHIASMNAVDTDSPGTPGSVVRYEMIGKGKALKFFQIDPENGNIRIKDDLRKEPSTNQYEINVRAYDLGDPQLSSMATLLVFVKHIQTKLETTTILSHESSEELGLAFGDDSYVTNIPETTNINAIIKLIPILNVKKATKTKNAFSCEITAGNELNLFAVTIEDLACAVKLRDGLDFENKTTHELEIKLHSSKQRINTEKSMATLKILIQDVNDNQPVFKFRHNNAHKRFSMRNDSYYGIVNYDSTIGTAVLKVEAYDEDSGTYGLIKYKLVDDELSTIGKDDPPSSYFIITETGAIRTRRPLHKAVDRQFSFKVEAMDNYGRDNGVIHRSYARVVINVLSDINRHILGISEIIPAEVQKHKFKLEEILSEKSNGNLVQIEKFAYRKAMMPNGTIIERQDSTDVFFYVLNPKTETILPRNQTNMMDSRVQHQIIPIISRLLRSQVEGVFAPLEMENEIHHLEISNSQQNSEAVNYSLITCAAVVLIVLIIGAAYTLIWWNKSQHSKVANNSTISNNQSTHHNSIRSDNSKFQNVQVNLKELIVAYDGGTR